MAGTFRSAIDRGVPQSAARGACAPFRAARFCMCSHAVNEASSEREIRREGARKLVARAPVRTIWMNGGSECWGSSKKFRGTPVHHLLGFFDACRALPACPSLCVDSAQCDGARRFACERIIFWRCVRAGGSERAFLALHMLLFFGMFLYMYMRVFCFRCATFRSVSCVLERCIRNQQCSRRYFLVKDAWILDKVQKLDLKRVAAGCARSRAILFCSS